MHCIHEFDFMLFLQGWYLIILVVEIVKLLKDRKIMYQSRSVINKGANGAGNKFQQLEKQPFPKKCYKYQQ